MPELRAVRENARLEIGSQRGRNSHQIGILGIYDLQGLSYGRTELLVADMRLLEPDPSGTPCKGLHAHGVRGGASTTKSVGAPAIGIRGGHEQGADLAPRPHRLTHLRQVAGGL